MEPRRFTELGDQEITGQQVNLEGHEHTAEKSWLVVTLRVQTVSRRPCYVQVERPRVVQRRGHLPS